MHRRFHLISGLLVASLGLATLAGASHPDHPSYDHSNAQDNQLVLRVAVADQASLANDYGLTVLRTLRGDDTLLLSRVAAGLEATQALAAMAGDPRLLGAEPVILASLPTLSAASLNDSGSTIWNDLVRTDFSATPCLDRAGLLGAWSGYSDQAAAQRIRLAEAHQASLDCGAVTVAVIDTGVDPEHPVLVGALVDGYDFLLDQPGTASEWSVLDQSVEAILEESMRALAEQSVEAILEGDGELVMLEASMAPVLDPTLVAGLDGSSLPLFFGHGTMVAGLIRLVAPSASIMPLRVFDGVGQGHLFDIVDAIYYAVDHGADVINMSFSMETSSRELQEALRYARAHGVVCVAAAGNQGQQTLVYPAGLAEALGVAATTNDDQLADFSNFGSALVDLGAPGSGVISSFPGGHFAAGWGTSFSTPLVAGAAALIHDLFAGNDLASTQHRRNAVRSGSVAISGLESAIGSGRLDAVGVLETGAQ